MKNCMVYLFVLFHLACEPIIPISQVEELPAHIKYAQPAPAPMQNEDGLSYVSFDLFKLAPAGHVQQIGPTLSPNAPGWNQMIAGQKSSSWRKPTQVGDQWVSWIKGRGGSLDFPITENDQSLEYVFIWIKPVAANQVVSIFLDEVLLENLSLKNHGRYYRLRLPQTLQPGEHRLRFWFRFTRTASWGGRTAGAIGPIHFFPPGVQPSHSQKLYDRLLLNQRRWGALLAPHPTTWRFYLMLPHQSSFKTNLYVKSKDTVRFNLSISTDEMGSRQLWSQVVPHDKITPIEIDLSEYAYQPIRLTLSTQLEHLEGQSDEKSQSSEDSQDAPIAWLDPQIISQHPNPKALPPIKSVLIWSLAGLRYDLLQYMLTHSEQYPNMARLLNHSYIIPSIWTQGMHEKGSHRYFLHPPQAKRSLPDILSQNQIYTSIWSAKPSFFDDLARLFDHTRIFDKQPKLTPLHTLSLIKSLGELLFQKPDAAHFMYLVSHELKLPMYQRNGFEIPELSNYKNMMNPNATYKKERNPYHAYLKQSIVVDYLFAQLWSTLYQTQQLQHTAIVIMGSIGQKFKETRSVDGIGMPEEVQVPVCIWYPGNRLTTQVAHHGGNLGSLAATLLETLVHTDPLPDYEWPYESLAPFILNRTPMPLHTEKVVSNGTTITRLGNFFMYERPHQSPVLWHLNDPHYAWQDLSDSRPITLRTLRDGLSVSHLREGL